jgi:hypothetical protein
MYQQTLGTKISDIPAQLGFEGSSSVYSIVYLLARAFEDRR